MSVDPVTARLVLTALTTGASVVGQMQTQRDQQSAADAQRDAEMQAFRDNIEASNRQVIQDAQASTEKANRAALEARRAQSTAKVSAGEAGVTGLSVDALMRDLAGQALENTNAVESNYLRRTEAATYDRINIRNRTISQLNNIQSPILPDYIGAGLKIADGINDYRSANKSTD